MDRKFAGLIGAVGALAALDSAQAATTSVDPNEVLKVRSYADLLNPIPNAMAALEAVDRARSVSDEGTQVAQFFEHHHHHHHHNSYYRRYRDEPRIVVVPPRMRVYRDHHHHHHHHHHSYYRRYRDDD